MNRVLVAGGRGFIGRRVVRLLRQTLPDAEVLCAGRSAANDRRLDVRSPDESYAALDGVDVLVNAAGPFNYDPRPLVRACIDRRAHYVDLAETPEFIAAASLTGKASAVVPGCSSVPGLIQVFARRWDGLEGLDRVRAQLSIGTANPASATLLFSMLEPIGRQGRWFDTTWSREHAKLGTRRYGTYPAGVERVAVAGREVPLKFGFGFDRRVYTLLLWLFAPLVALTPRPLLKVEARIGAALTPLIRALGTRVGVLSLDALDAAGAVLDSFEIRASDRGLDVPAWPSVWATEALLTHPGSGSLTLADLISPQVAAGKLVTAGYQVLAGILSD